jgi:hypothetical protein
MSTPLSSEWLSIRHKWETTPRITFGEAGAGYGVSKQAVAQKAKKEGWEKSTNLSAINQQAHKKADGLTAPVDGVVDIVDITTEESIDVRAAILAKHRGEYETLDRLQRLAIELFVEAIKFKKNAIDDGRDPDDPKLNQEIKAMLLSAKIAADTCKSHIQSSTLKHEGESQAWGLNLYQFEQSIDKKSLTIDELDFIIEKGEFPTSLTKGKKLKL